MAGKDGQVQKFSGPLALCIFLAEGLVRKKSQRFLDSCGISYLRPLLGRQENKDREKGALGSAARPLWPHRSFCWKKWKQPLLLICFCCHWGRCPIMRKEVVELVWLPNLVFYKIRNWTIFLVVIRCWWRTINSIFNLSNWISLAIHMKP